MHDLDGHDRHRRPWNLAEQRQQGSREDVGLRGTPVLEDGLARPHHVRLVGLVAQHLEREIRLHARRHVETAVLEQRPSPTRLLPLAEITGELQFELAVQLFAPERLEQNVFAGDRNIRFEFEDEMSVGSLAPQKRVRRATDRTIEPIMAAEGRQTLDRLRFLA